MESKENNGRLLGFMELNGLEFYDISSNQYGKGYVYVHHIYLNKVI
jgi:hypothetical protein